ncbi:MAG: L-seryl-tRNA(Sec) selenium transferase [Micropruina sp.]
MISDPRRAIPRTDDLLAHPQIAGTSRPERLLAVIRQVQGLAREGLIAPTDVAAVVAAHLHTPALPPVINATGVLVHTNLGRAALSQAAIDAMVDAAGCTPIEFDLATGRRGRRAPAVTEILLSCVPGAEAALVVNNGAAALLLATTALAGDVLMSRGEMPEIGDGFRLHELIAAGSVRVREVGTTNRTTRGDFQRAVDDRTGCILRVHPSNYRVDGFTTAPRIEELTGFGVPVVVDTGSGLLAPDPALPDEPDAHSALAAGAALVVASGDKLLGGPQAGLILGRADLVERLRRHPLARALRPGKLVLAALAATLNGPPPPVHRQLHADPDVLADRARTLAALTDGTVIPTQAVVGGGGAPGHQLASWGVAYPESLADRLRAGTPIVVGRVEEGRTVLDLRTVPAEQDEQLAAAVRACR